MKNIFIIIACITVFGCNKMEYYQVNPNDPTVGVPSAFLTEVERALFDNVLEYSTISVASRYLVGYSYHGETYQYYRWANGSFNRYNNIRNVNEMERWAGENPNYIALAKLFRSIFYYELTMTFGDIPYSESMQLIDGVSKPKYDTQKDIFLGILKELEEANNLLNSLSGPINGDFIYNGDILKWKKFINSFKIRILLSLSHHENDNDLKIKSVFSDIMQNPSKYPIFQGNEDNAQRIGNLLVPHPFYFDGLYSTYYGTDEDFINALKERNDPRIKFYANITKAAKDAGLPPTDMNAYKGLPGSAPNEENTANLVSASYSSSNYYTRYDYEPIIYMGYYEVNFLIAEAITRGWWNGGTASSYYEEGVRASMKHWGIPDSEIQTYLNQPLVQFQTSTTELELEQILFQKYLASNMNSGWEAFYTQRRTGVPVFDVSGGGMLEHKIALRWNYPVNEYLLNKENIEEAVSRQFQGAETIYSQMWLIK